MTVRPSCERVRAALDDYVDHRLTATERRQVDDHLRGCEECRRELRELERLLAAVARLTGTVAPERDLWPGIVERLAPRRAARSPRSGAWQLAAALVALLAGAILFLRGPSEPPRIPPVAELPGAAATAPSTSDLADLARWEDGCSRLRRDVLVAVERSRDQLRPATVSTIETNLGILDQAVGELRQAASERPHDPGLQLRLAAAYRHEVELLNRLDRLRRTT